ncbi:MAG TPA: hypothetical protein PL110_05300 [Candidatus Eremiobacteraeota bacterium]|nr:MAG: hypothetical protein BWY64_01956 [bacterium ADurb.Bin363]HPZ07508.1 hypothetical protein [Candidatus Eremiobacteraeota bacterium]
MNQDKKNQWLTGPKPQKQGGGGWRETEEMMRRQMMKRSAGISDSVIDSNEIIGKQTPLLNSLPCPLGRKINRSPVIDNDIPKVQSPLTGIKNPVLPEKETFSREVQGIEEKERKKPTEIEKIQDIKPVKQVAPPFKILSYDRDGTEESFRQLKMLEKIKYMVSEEEEETSFEYYEGKIMEPEEEEKPVETVQKEIYVPTNPVRSYLEKMIVYSPSPRLTDFLFKELELLGEVLVSECQKFGIGLLIFEHYRNLTEIQINNQYPFPSGTKVRDGRGWEYVRGAYNPQHRMMFMAEELITGVPGGVATHEFAHAYDHAWMVNNEMKFGFSVFLWNKFYEEGEFVTEYASTQPKEYFAVSLEWYFHPEKSALLKKNDPRMYGFITNLIKGVHKKPAKGLSD